MVVVLPAPDGPMTPSIVPTGTVRLMACTAASSPNRFATPSMTTAGSVPATTGADD